MQNAEKKRVVIIGAGASGLVAAIMAAKNGASVTVLEHNEKPGKKLLATGNGRCNLTNLYQDPSCYHTKEDGFAWKVLSQFSAEDTKQFFADLGIYFKDRDGYLYPASGQASSVLEVLLMEAAYRKVKMKYQEEVTSIVKNGTKEVPYLVKTKTWQYEADAVILASGSPASIVEGADESGYAIAKEMGHGIKKPLPALVPLKCKGNYFAKWAGVRVEGAISLLLEKKTLYKERGELQLTEYGISGIPVFQISGPCERLLDEKKAVELSVDFTPDFTLDELKLYFQNRQKQCPYKTLKELLTGIFPKKLIDVLVQKKDTIDTVAVRCKDFKMSVIGAKSLKQAQICSGGIKTEEIKTTMESKLHHGLYFAGEIIDVDGICGGYNLQWAWSSGAVAGTNAAKGE